MTMYFWPVFAQFYAFLFSRSFFFSKPTGLPKSYDSDLILHNAAIFEIIEMAILCLNDNDTNHDLAMLKKSQGGLFLASLRTSSDDHIPDKVDNNVSGIMTIFCLRFKPGTYSKTKISFPETTTFLQPPVMGIKDERR